MVIILPEKMNGLKTLVENLHQVNLSETLQQLYRKDVEIYLPKFKTESTLDLKTTLKKVKSMNCFSV